MNFNNSYTAPSRCHPNPCENGATCTDRYYYMAMVEGVSSRGVGDSGRGGGGDDVTPDAASVATTTSDVMHKIQENEELAIINEGSNLIGSPSSALSNNNENNENEAQERSLLDLAPSELHANDLIREEIHNGAGETPTSLKGLISRIDYGLIARRNGIGAKNLSSSSPSSSKWKREAGEGLPSGIDQSILDTFGFYCTCPEGFKGLKCGREFCFILFLFIYSQSPNCKLLNSMVCSIYS